MYEYYSIIKCEYGQPLPKSISSQPMDNCAFLQHNSDFPIIQLWFSTIQLWLPNKDGAKLFQNLAKCSQNSITFVLNCYPI